MYECTKDDAFLMKVRLRNTTRNVEAQCSPTPPRQKGPLGGGAELPLERGVEPRQHLHAIYCPIRVFGTLYIVIVI